MESIKYQVYCVRKNSRNNIQGSTARTCEYHRLKILLRLAGLWGVINNAGIAKVGPIEWQTIEEYKQVADVNLWGLIDVTKVFLPLIKKERGRIINIASIGGEWVVKLKFSKY